MLYRQNYPLSMIAHSLNTLKGTIDVSEDYFSFSIEVEVNYKRENVYK